jgi:colicin import membrane protein
MKKQREEAPDEAKVDRLLLAAWKVARFLPWGPGPRLLSDTKDSALYDLAWAERDAWGTALDTSYPSSKALRFLIKSPEKRQAQLTEWEQARKDRPWDHNIYRLRNIVLAAAAAGFKTDPAVVEEARKAQILTTASGARTQDVNPSWLRRMQRLRAVIGDEPCCSSCASGGPCNTAASPTAKARELKAAAYVEVEDARRRVATAQARSQSSARPQAALDDAKYELEALSRYESGPPLTKRELAKASRALAQRKKTERAAAKREAELAAKAAAKEKLAAKRAKKQAQAAARRQAAKARAEARRQKKAAAKKKPSSCSGSIAGQLKAAQTLAAKAAHRLRASVEALEKRHTAAAERLRVQQQTAAVKLDALIRAATSKVARRLYQRRLQRSRSSLAMRLKELAREHKAALKALPRQVECAVLSRKAATGLVDSYCGASCHLGLPGGIGGAESLVTLQTGRGSLKVLPARFVLTSAATLVPSHDAQTFDARPDYPELVQERRYDADQLERMKVVDIAQNMQPGLVANTNVGAVDGTPVAVNGVGVVLGGNGRTMGAQRHYASGRHVLADYLVRHAAQFGLTADAVRSIKDPIVVRVVDAPRSEWPRLVRDLNVGLTQSMDATTEAVAQARHFPPDVVKLLAAGLADAEIGEWLRSRASLPLVGALERSGFLTRANRGRYLTKDGLLSAEAHTALERQLLASLVPDAALLDRLGAEVRGTLTRSAPFWLAAAAAGGSWDVRGALLAAVKDLAELRSDGQCLAQWEQQGSLIPRATRKGTTGETLLQLLDLAGGKPVVFTKIARQFYQDSAGGGLFGSKDPIQALTEAAATVAVNPTSAASRRRCKK